MKHLYTTILFYLLYMPLSTSQNISDVVRYSWYQRMNTARVAGVGDAFGALGGDFGSIQINPAGIADFRISEFTFTPNISIADSEAYLQKDPARSNTTYSKLLLNQLGIVLASNQSRGKWTTSNFAMGFSRLADFNRNIYFEGKTQGSITQMFSENARNLTVDQLDDFITFPAYNVGAIFDFDNDLNYENDFLSEETQVYKSQSINQSGGINQLDIAWAGEYNNRLNFGISLGIPFVRFEELKEYKEIDRDANIPIFNALTYTEYVSTSGVGINIKAGMTAKLGYNFRLGAALHSPTYLRLSDDYYTSIIYDYNDGTTNVNSYDSPDGTFQYRITNPWRAIGSIGYIYRLSDIKGFINIDIEHLDYSFASYNGTSNSSDPDEQAYTNAVNRDVLAQLGAVTNIRIGTELDLSLIRIRAGYATDKSPFKADETINNVINLGLGYRGEKFFIDGAYRIFNRDEGYNPYIVNNPDLDPLTNINTRKSLFIATLGFKF